MASMSSSSSSSLQTFFFFLPLIYLQFSSIPTVTAQLFPYAVCSTTAGNFTTNSTYQTTLTSLFSTISSPNTISYGFFNGSSTTQTAEQISAVGFCRGDVPAAACRTCLQTSATDVRNLCPNQKEAVVWNENCTFRYSNESIFGTPATDPDYQLLNTQNVSNPTDFNAALQRLLEGLRPAAAGGGPLRKFATGNTTVGFQTIYGLLQCTPDLSEQQCSDCLVTIIGRIPQCCAGKMGGRVMAPSCYMRFESARFFDGPAEALPPPPPPPPSPDTVPPPVTTSPPPGSKSNSTVIIIVVVAVAAVVVLGIIAFFLVRRRKKPRQRVEYEAVDEISTAESLQFDFATVSAATDGFSEAKKLGRGGFGAVYKGKLPNGQEIAVKRLASNSGQGEVEFKNEVMLLAQLQHRNLVRLLGFCLEGSERLLIYEYVPNASLDHFLFDPLKRGLLNWESRHKIILGTARGLLYLHEDSRLRIIHRDMKASNILLDDAMNPKISDFGMARLFTQDQTRADTSRIVGTYGYMSPEYAMHGNFSVKSDVYSFGVMVLEIVSGQRNNSFLNGGRVEDLISSAWRNWREGTVSNIIDPSLQSGSRTEMARCIHIGLLCVQENVADRPTMASVVLMLNSHSMTLQVPTQPGFFLRSGIESDLSSTEFHNTTTSSNGNKAARKSLDQFSYNDVTNTEPYPR